MIVTHSVKVVRKQGAVYLYDPHTNKPLCQLDHDSTVELANDLLNAAGHMKQEEDEES